jgi:ElaA protein
MELKWIYKSFDELTVVELYAILQLRNEVFSVEQNCVYQDADDKDQKSFHLAGWDGNKLVAYCRILPKGLSYADASIGRVVTSPVYRKTGCGRLLMAKAIVQTLSQFTCSKITISAQFYLTNFYESLGFTAFGATYLEDDIPHIEMHYSV